MVAVPTPTALIEVGTVFPVILSVVVTIATILLSLVVHWIAWFVAFWGLMLTFGKLAISPEVISIVVGFTETPITETTAVTVTSHVAVKPPSAVITVRVAVPAFPARMPICIVVFPFVSVTIATIFLSLVVHVTDLFVAAEGDMVTVGKLAVSPEVSVMVVGLIETPPTGTVI
jgi:hypothetical protein